MHINHCGLQCPASNISLVYNLFSTCSDNADAGMDMVFEVTMRDIFTQADHENKGFITLKQFNKVII